MTCIVARRKTLCRFALLVLSALFASAFFAAAQGAYDEPWRPQYHFTPAKNFMNDPNGLVYYKGEYNLFYQHNPQGAEWGHMTWGHAISDDMLHWRHLPLAIPEKPGRYMVYSGSAVVDWQNSSGLCSSSEPRDPSCLIAIYTAAGSDSQKQHLAFSNDRGRTWSNYSANPVADLNQPDFRDPKVFWYEPQKKWIMVAVFADEKQVKILDSADLKNWTLRSTFGPLGVGKGQWECPDLFELPLDNGAGAKKWVMVVNRNPGAPAGGTGVQYFVGNFDGAKFTNGTPAGKELWADYGKDFYATNSFSDIPASDGRRIWIGWISNWQYANAEPTKLWRGAQSLPRVLRLKTYPDGIRLVQAPVKEVERLRTKQLLRGGAFSIQQANAKIHAANIQGDTLEIEADLVPDGATELGFRLRKGENDQTLVGVSARTHGLFIDRTRSGLVSFSPDFPGRHHANLNWTSSAKLHIFLDRSSLEVFANDGETVLTDRIYPSPGSDGLELYSDSGDSKIQSLTIWQLGSIWK
ncbi:MAG TPA: glycoside hydrolase family 32 protein [Candidatus Acidoferrum sp.]|nr:glycoside hydrolase family 32 protein [Candidatus Acidoferrum sp.]